MTIRDGERIGFRTHLRTANDTRFGHIRWDNRDHVDVVVPAYCRHFHSLDGSLVVGDGSPVYLLPAMLNTTVTWPYILLYRRQDDALGSAAHRGVSRQHLQRAALAPSSAPPAGRTAPPLHLRRFRLL